MEREEFSNNDRLGRLIREIPPDMPSGDFVDRVMATIQPVPDLVPEKTSWISYMNSALPYAALILFCAVFFFNSDLPFLNRIEGEGYFYNQIMTFVSSLTTGLKTALASRYITYGFLISVAGIFLFFLDRYFTRRTAV